MDRSDVRQARRETVWKWLGLFAALAAGTLIVAVAVGYTLSSWLGV